MKKLKIYLDTSVINFLFAEDAPVQRDITQDFFEKYVGRNRYKSFVSPVVIDEISRTSNRKKRDQLMAIIDEYPIEILDLSKDTAEVERIAQIYIEENIIPIRKIDDALHLAICTVNEMDVLLSWNYRHLANINREMRIMAENLKEGYTHFFRMVTPLEVMYEEE